MTRSADAGVLEFDDEQQYWSMAQSLRAGEGLPDELGFQATRMPLYPAFLSLLVDLPDAVVVAKVLHWFLGALAAVLTACAASALLSDRVGIVSGLAVAVDPFFVFFSSLLLTETAFMAALAGLWWVLSPALRTGTVSLGRWVAIGVVAALCVYIRESSLGLVFVTLALVVAWRRFDRRCLLGVSMVVGLVVLLLLPWAIRNQQVTGSWCWLTTRAGISLYDGVGPQATGASDLGDVKQMPAVAGLGEAEWNQYFLRESMRAIRDDPGRVVRLAGVKLGRMWNPFPNVETYQSSLTRVVSVMWTIPVFVLAAAGVFLLMTTDRTVDSYRAWFLLLPAIYLSALHSLFIGSVRYRVGAMPFLEILAALALVALVDRVRRASSTREQTVA